MKDAPAAQAAQWAPLQLAAPARHAQARRLAAVSAPPASLVYPSGAMCAAMYARGADSVTLQVLAHAFESFAPTERTTMTRALDMSCAPTQPLAHILEVLGLYSRTPSHDWMQVTARLQPFRNSDPQTVYAAMAQPAPNPSQQRAARLAVHPHFAALPLDQPSRAALLHDFAQSGHPLEALTNLRRVSTLDGELGERGLGLRDKDLASVGGLLAALSPKTQEALTRDFHGRLMFWRPEHIRTVLHNLAPLPYETREAECAGYLTLRGVVTPTDDDIIRAYFGMPSQERPKFVEQATMLLGSRTLTDGRSDIVTILRGVPQQERDEFVKLAVKLSGASSSGKSRAALIETLAHVPAAERAAFVTQMTSLCKRSINGQARVGVARDLQRARNEDRPSIVATMLPIVNSGLAPKKLRWAMTAVAKLPAAEHPALLVQAQRLVPDSASQQLPTMLNFLARIPAADRDAATTALLAFDLNAESLVTAASQCIVQLPGPETRAILEVAAPLRAIAQHPMRFGTCLWELVNDEPEDRAAHVQALLAQPLNGEGGNVENVMNGQRIANTRTSIEKFMVETDALKEESANFRSVLGDMKAFFVQRYSDASNVPVGEWDAVMNTGRTAGKANEMQNFLRALDGAKQTGDYSHSMAQNPRYHLRDREYVGLGLLAARLWTFIDHYRGFVSDVEQVESAKTSMRYGLFRAIGDCIESDGHRVCGVGLSQRLILVAQGRCNGVHVDDRPTPNQFLQQGAEHYFQYKLKMREPTEQEIAAFYKDTEEQAKKLYGNDTFTVGKVEQRYYDVVHRNLLDFMDLTYQWTPGSPAAQG